ncbi:TetR/AcrR family transcriptional regulator [Marinactinospora thermotolerans]|uniref:Transcriptional regulator, TetR family n=1 Tax=Marinactinospora thermotolerans DSM 45154 TaxID=1122192 RepID=A0A1T4KCW8_9ACTN|nr:TetR/AcrR family transcriptional regulator [Marinactinospora thermotolerans]SJZ40165.1 transcriptional regulator, TetR family [Marinactinospora thermotolerans DSM 45154]
MSQTAKHPAPSPRERGQAAGRRPRLSSRGMATRRRLLTAARQEILSGDGTLEVADVAGRSQVSAGLLYRYFGSKDGLISAVVDEFYDAYDAAVFTTRIGAGGWLASEYERIRREIDFLCDDPLGRVIVGRRLREPAAAQTDAERLARQVGIAARGIERGQRSGELDASVDPRYAAAAILGAFRELMAEALSGEGEPSREELLDVMWRTGTSLLLPVKG